MFANSSSTWVSRHFDPRNFPLCADENRLIELSRTSKLNPEVSDSRKSLSDEL